MTEVWPELPVVAWEKTRATIHMWTQIIGKIRMAQVPMMNHWWQVTLYLTSRGLTTGPMPHGKRTFQIDFDFIDHALRITADDGSGDTIKLRPMTVADFYADLMGRLNKLGLGVHIYTMPCEVENPIRFDRDTQHADYDPDFANRCWRVLLAATNVMTDFRGRFQGKSSPVHFFWGSFDLALTRFSGRIAPLHPGAPLIPDYVTREAYSHEVSSFGFWPGVEGASDAVFYSYAYPQPPGFEKAAVAPKAASYSAKFGEFLLPYEAMRKSPSPEDMLMQFLQSTYEAAANLAKWDRAALDCDEKEVPRRKSA